MGNHCVRGFCCAGNPLSQTLPGLPAVPEGGASALQPGRGSLSLQTGSASEKGFALLLFSAATPSQLRFAQQLSQGESQGHDGSASCLSLWERWHGVSRDGEGERLPLRGSLSLQTGSASEKGFALLLFSAATPSQLRFAQQLSQGESQGHDGSASCLSLWERWHGVSRDGEGERLPLRGSWHREAMTERVYPQKLLWT